MQENLPIPRNREVFADLDKIGAGVLSPRRVKQKPARKSRQVILHIFSFKAKPTFIPIINEFFESCLGFVHMYFLQLNHTR